MLKIDLGCGPSKTEGFLGVDRFALPGVDIVADLDSKLPFASNSVDLVYASHSLEHVSDLIATMQEIYRICKHNAQICIVAPYSEQKLNAANPYHKHVFNEHTPRFWTDHPDAPIDSRDYYHPHASRWGLARSDYSEPTMDFRITRMEFFYFPEYQSMTPDEQRRMRSQRWDVCDQIMYHLVAWKESAAGMATSEAGSGEPFVPQFVLQRRSQVHEAASPA
jgi:predicted SAM-dependent methyltransferase